MKNKHTAGNWSYLKEIHMITVYSERNGAICEINHNGKVIDEHEANAKLIAAAPTLLAMAQLGLKNASFMVTQSIGAKQEAWQYDADLFKTAIAKANL